MHIHAENNPSFPVNAPEGGVSSSKSHASSLVHQSERQEQLIKSGR